MQELEKILEEIDASAIYAETKEGYGAMCVPVGAIERIIRKHMNDGWISVEERLPEELAPVLVTACVPVRKPGWDKRKECCVVVDTDVYGWTI